MSDTPQIPRFACVLSFVDDDKGGFLYHRELLPRRAFGNSPGVEARFRTLPGLRMGKLLHNLMQLATTDPKVRWELEKMTAHLSPYGQSRMLKPLRVEYDGVSRVTPWSPWPLEQPNFTKPTRTTTVNKITNT